MIRSTRVAVVLVWLSVMVTSGGAKSGSGITELPVPASNIPAGHIVEAADITNRKFHTTPRSLSGIALSASDVSGRETRRNLIAGRPIPLSALIKPLAVHRGAKVIALFEEDGFTITAQLLALEDGAEGDTIAVRNIDSGAIIRAKVQKDGRLAVVDGS